MWPLVSHECLRSNCIGLLLLYSCACVLTGKEEEEEGRRKNKKKKEEEKEEDAHVLFRYVRYSSGCLERLTERRCG
ncbi:hypothetical protein E2C01_093341 [Portunus trituberculatus]|uniref:Secreted protein n=1 Tax=Portunus trituberculatus TaxID=210409 RepID=A0A5B7JPI7_PORTR|nr:hypothetical protein [Portunus trituberculatus]